jgi:hypothetical protein
MMGRVFLVGGQEVKIVTGCGPACPVMWGAGGPLPDHTGPCSPGRRLPEEGWPRLENQGVLWSSSARLTVAAIFW